MRQHLLTILVLLPVLGALVAIGYSLMPSSQEANYKWIALALTTLTFILSLLLIQGVGADAGQFRFEENVSWIGAIGARYHLGVDGISLWLVVLTTLLMPPLKASPAAAAHSVNVPFPVLRYNVQGRDCVPPTNRSR